MSFPTAGVFHHIFNTPKQRPITYDQDLFSDGYWACSKCKEYFVTNSNFGLRQCSDMSFDHSVVYITGPYDRGERYSNNKFAYMRKMAFLTMKIHRNSMS